MLAVQIAKNMQHVASLALRNSSQKKKERTKKPEIDCITKQNLPITVGHYFAWSNIKI